MSMYVGTGRPPSLILVGPLRDRRTGAALSHDNVHVFYASRQPRDAGHVTPLDDRSER